MYLLYFIFIIVIQKSAILVFSDAAFSSEFIVSSETLIGKEQERIRKKSGPGVT